MNNRYNLSCHIDVSICYYLRHRRANRNPISVDVDCNSSETKGLQKQNCDLEDLKKVAFKLSEKTNSVLNKLSKKQDGFETLKQLSGDNATELDDEIRYRDNFLQNLTKTREKLEAHYRTLVELSNHQKLRMNCSYLPIKNIS